MTGKEILVDTNIIIYLLQGDDTLAALLQGKNLYVSFMTELELYSLPSLTSVQEKEIELMLNDFFIIPMSAKIKNEYKSLRKSCKLKLVDSLIAATAIAIDIPLITADRQFKAVKNLKIIEYIK